MWKKRMEKTGGRKKAKEEVKESVPTDDDEGWQCGKCDGMDLEGHSRHCLKRKIQEWKEKQMGKLT